MNNQTKKIIKIIISILAGIGISISAFFAFLMLRFASLEQHMYRPLLIITYVSIMVFLVLWNIIRTKRIYFIFLVPVICICTGIIIGMYHHHIRQIPIVSEQDYFFTSKYMPFRKENILAKLDEESSLQISNNLPVLDGATALFSVYASFVQSVYQKDVYINSVNNEITRNRTVFSNPLIFCSGTTRAYENLLDEKADMIFSFEPSEAQLKMFHDNNINLKMIPIGKEAFVFFVNKENPISNVSVENIIGIYSGRIKNWKELNGKNQSIRAFQRPENSGSQTMLEKIMKGNVIEKAQREDVPAGMGGIINQVANYRNFPDAIGFSFLFFSTEMVQNNQIKLLSVDGVYPSKETIQNNSYPFSDNFYAIYVDKKERNKNIDVFIDWILSEQGQELIQKSGYTPIER